jgi:integrase
VFIPIAVKAKLRPADTKDAENVELVGLHTLRHTYASTLIAQGENFKYVSRQLGHATIAITLNTYSHLLKETSTSAMARLAMRIPNSDAATVVPIATGTHG